MNDDATAFADILHALPLYAPVDERRRGRVSSTTVDPGATLPTKVVVDFGSTPEGPDSGPDLEIATRAWEAGTAPGERELRGFCAERDLMERRMRDPLSAQAIGPPPDAAWSQARITLDADPYTFTVLTTAHTWVAATVLPGPFLLRIFTPAPGPHPTHLRRITSATQLEPLRGRG
ncbi:hypothetical protein CDO52_16110 [Nocardiopsis gilva YIM 90087]|uniref:Uncharacterized protein n=1 Tax=Nocardiopsis gilva YIM 90087 TaxID=1235441 RepID=A0A223S7L2_9ACTN|nr:hypothetical protein [Nocardiopsis gilva]ASU84108.1 hypothetical protein CDO52_16110 [Nocardiopsis gilva YIM 90087]